MEYKKPGQIITVYLLIAETKLLPGGGPFPPAFLCPAVFGIYISAPSTYSCTCSSSSRSRMTDDIMKEHMAYTGAAMERGMTFMSGL